MGNIRKILLGLGLTAIAGTISTLVYVDDKVAGIEFSVSEYNQITNQSVENVDIYTLQKEIMNDWIVNDGRLLMSSEHKTLYAEYDKIKDKKSLNKYEVDILLSALNAKSHQIKSNCLLSERCRMVDKNAIDEKLQGIIVK